MAIYRVNKDSNYTTISNTHLRDGRLTLKAKGLLTLVLSLSPDWNYSISGLAAICKEGTTAVKAALKELKDCGYLTITKIPPTKDSNRTFDYQYDFYEKPLGVENLPLENLPVENLAIENLKQLNTDHKDLDKLNTDDKKRAHPSVEEIKQYADTICKQPFDAEYFHDYWSSRGWMRGGDHITDWKATLRNWIARDEKDNQPSTQSHATTSHDAKLCPQCGQSHLYRNRQMGRYECGNCFYTET